MVQSGKRFGSMQVQEESLILKPGLFPTWVAHKLILFRFVTISLMLFLAGCLPPSESFNNSSPMDFSRDPMQQARINSFLVLEDPFGPGMRIEIASIEVLADGVWLPLINSSLMIDSAKLGEDQLFVGGQNIPPGEYSRLRMTIVRGEMQNSNGEYVEIKSDPVKVDLRLTTPLSIHLDDSMTLFFTWDVEESMDVSNGFQPVIVAGPPTKEMLQDLIFVSCPNIDTVFVVRADNNWVVNSFGLKGGPTYLDFDQNTSNQRLYVLASRERMIKVVDPTTYRIVEFFSVPLNDDPTFMTISPDGRELYLLDEKSGNLSRVDTDTGKVQARTFLGYSPSFALYLPGHNLLAVSLSLSQEVVFLDPLTLENTNSIPTGSSPQGMLIDGNTLYITEKGDNSISISDLGSRGKINRLQVGFGPRRLIAADNQIYVSNYRDGTLSVLGAGEFGVVQEIFGFGRPGEMALDQFYHRLYVSDEESGALKVVDVNANRLINHIELGALPFGMAVIQ